MRFFIPLLSIVLLYGCGGHGTPPLIKNVAPKRISPYRGLSADASHVCTIDPGGQVKCWGDNTYGQLGIGTYGINRGLASPPSTGVELGMGDDGTPLIAFKVATGFGHSCAILNDGSLKCWGLNSSGQLGIITSSDILPEPATTPIDLKSRGLVRQVSLGQHHSCAVLNDYSIKCWGDNSHGQLGIGNAPSILEIPLFSAINLGRNKSAFRVTTGVGHSCAILQDDYLVKCWGHNSFGQLGRGNFASSSTPLSRPIDLGQDKRAHCSEQWGLPQLRYSRQPLC